MGSKFLVATLLLTASALSQNPQHQPSDIQSVQLTYQHGCGAPFGSFELTIFRDGHFEYFGKYHVKKTGAKKGQVSPAAVNQLLADVAHPTCYSDRPKPPSLSGVIYWGVWVEVREDGGKCYLTQMDDLNHIQAEMLEMSGAKNWVKYKGKRQVCL